jgi:iron complex transport system substrate-binding protein
VRDALADVEPVAVATLEWLHPVYVGGHWVPQMVEIAGGVDVLGQPGERSRVAAWDEVRDASAAVVVCMPCGYDLPASVEQATLHPEVFELGLPVYAVDASGHFSRPGPRLVDGIEQLAQILHPDEAPAAATSWQRVEPVPA